MKIRTQILTLLSLLAFSACQSPLEKAKETAKKRIAADNPVLLKELRLEQMDLAAKDIGKTEIPWGGATLYVPQPVRQDSAERGIRLLYPEFTVTVLKAVGGSDFSSLPASWGRDDLDKMCYIYTVSGAAIDAAADFKQLEEAIVRLTARGTLAPVWAFDRIAWVTTPTFEGLLSGDFATSTTMELYFRPKADSSKVCRIVFKHVGSGARADVVRFLQSVSAAPKR